jgi:hypothetical protein
MGGILEKIIMKLFGFDEIHECKYPRISMNYK